jgi:hypothetical protein
VSWGEAVGDVDEAVLLGGEVVGGRLPSGEVAAVVGVADPEDGVSDVEGEDVGAGDVVLGSGLPVAEGVTEAVVAVHVTITESSPTPVSSVYVAATEAVPAATHLTSSAFSSWEEISTKSGTENCHRPSPSPPDTVPITLTTSPTGADSRSTVSCT